LTFQAVEKTAWKFGDKPTATARWYPGPILKFFFFFFAETIVGPPEFDENIWNAIAVLSREKYPNDIKTMLHNFFCVLKQNNGRWINSDWWVDSCWKKKRVGDKVGGTTLNVAGLIHLRAEKKWDPKPNLLKSSNLSKKHKLPIERTADRISNVYVITWNTQQNQKKKKDLILLNFLWKFDEKIKIWICSLTN